MEALRHCFPQNLRQFLNELPESLDETYERILKGINKAQRNNAHRLLQCLTVASRPLRVEEVAELLAFDFQAMSSIGLPALKEDWRWDDQEEAVLSTCSSLIAIVPSGDSRVVQFSHFSVKEYLTSPRLARSHGDVSRFHIDLGPAHTIMAQACLATLLRREEQAGDSGAKGSPLVKYAAQHWVDHTQFEKVSSHVSNGMVDLFDTSKPHFAAWLQVHNIDEGWSNFSPWPPGGIGSPLYYAAFCGFYNLAELLIMKHPEQVNALGGRNLFPLPAALSKRHFRVANLLHKHGAVVDVRGSCKRTPLHVASISGSVDIMRWLLDHHADANSRNWVGRSPLHFAAYHMRLDAVRDLLEHNADTNLLSNIDETPLSDLLTRHDSSLDGKIADIVRQLLEHGANTNIRNSSHSTALHQVSSRGWPKVTQLLLSYGAKVDERDEEGKTPFQLAASSGYHEVAKLLLEHSAVPQP